MKTNPNDPVVAQYNNGILISSGLTKREYFAVLAMQAVISLPDSQHPYVNRDEATIGVYFADQLIEKLNETQDD